jgi:DNA-directed RNA polymerase specialized sigma24 family protein
MLGELPFPDLIAFIRDGDESAAAEFVRRFEAPLLRSIRNFLVRSPLLYRLDAEDVSQMAFAEILDHLMQKRDVFLPNEEAASKLLSRTARYRLLDELRKVSAACRAGSTVSGDAVDSIPDSGGTPSAKVRNRELYDLIHDRLTEDERYLVDRRMSGDPWPVIAEALGGTPEGVRKRFERIFARLRIEFGFVEE